MTDQERQMIEALAKRIQDAPAPQIDRDADDLIRRAIGARPDALYILTGSDSGDGADSGQSADRRAEAARPGGGSRFIELSWIELG